MEHTLKQLSTAIDSTVGPIRKTSGKNKKLWHTIHDVTSYLPDSAKIKERIYCIKSRITTPVQCKRCDNFVQFLGPTGGYREYCSCVCAGNDDDTKQKRKVTNNIKYGVDYPALNTKVADKRTKTLETKYGPGITSTQQVPAVYQKTVDTNMRNHQTYHGNDSHIDKIVLRQLGDPEWLANENVTKSIYQISIECDVSFGLVERAFERFGIKIKRHKVSIGEQQLHDWIKSIYDGEIVQSDRSKIAPYEIDIYIPELNIGIEYNGLYWHSETIRPDKNYHKAKLEKANTAGVSLIQIWENEWIDSRPIVEHRLRYQLTTQPTIGARKCVIMSCSQQDAEKFFDQYHIQGGSVINSKTINICAKHDDTIVSVMSFGKARYSQQSQYELLRFASSIPVAGGGSKMLRYFEDSYAPNSIISYCDRRWGDGNSYTKMGFTLDGITPPNYYYFVNGTTVLFSRQKFQKHKLEKQLGVFYPQLTETENMLINGYNKIYDCGHLRYLKTY